MAVFANSLTRFVGVVAAFRERHDVVADGGGADADAVVAKLALVAVAGQDTQPALAVLRCVGACDAGLALPAALPFMLGAISGSAAISGDVGAVKAVLAVMERRSRLFGLDTPQRLAVGISESEFGRRAAELLKITGPGPLLKLARSAPLEAEVVQLGAGEDGWSNIGGPDPAATAHR